MLIAVSIITSDKQWRDFCLHTLDLEIVFNTLIDITRCGDTIVEARLVDQERCVLLPLEFLDQQPRLNPISRLRIQWELILDQSVNAHLESKPAHNDWMQHWQSSRQQQVNYQLLLLGQVNQLAKMAQESIAESPRKNRLLANYQRIVDGCTSSIARLETIPSFTSQ